MLRIEHTFDTVMRMAGGLFAELEALDGSDIAGFASDQVDSALRLLGQLDGWKAKVESALLNRAAVLARAGQAPDPEDSLRKQQRGSSAENRKKTKRANAAAKTPALADSLGAGTTTAAHIDAVANAAQDLEPDQQDALFDAANAHVADAEALTIEAYRRKLARLVDRIRRDEGLDRDAEQRRTTNLRKWINPKSGMYVLNGEFHPELGEKLFGRIDAEVERLWRQSTAGATDTTVMPDTQRRNASLAAHALVSLAGNGHAGECSSTPEVIVLIDDKTLETGIHDHSVSETALGTYLPPDTIRRLCCDAKVNFVSGRGNDLAVGRTARTANRAQRRALRSLYRSCAFDGCTKPFDWCQIHHVEPWSSLGATDLDNLLPLCHTHHHKVHEGKWQLKLLPDRTLKIYRPDGTHFSTNAPPDLRETRSQSRPPDRQPQPA